MEHGVIDRTAGRIEYLVKIIPPLLTRIPPEEFSYKPSPGRWSKKQIIGHLVDSASNNHHRFIRARIEDEPMIRYNQDQWNDLTRYNELNASDVINIWTSYNKLLAHVIRGMSSEDLERKCFTGDATPLTLQFIIQDYVVHLEHHLRQVVNYD
jgi:hypothetical protein